MKSVSEMSRFMNNQIRKMPRKDISLESESLVLGLRPLLSQLGLPRLLLQVTLAEHGGIACLGNTRVVHLFLEPLVDRVAHATTLVNSLVRSNLALRRILLVGRRGLRVVTNWVAADELAELVVRIFLFAEVTEQLTIILGRLASVVDGAGSGACSLATLEESIVLGRRSGRLRAIGRSQRSKLSLRMTLVTGGETTSFLSIALEEAESLSLLVDNLALFVTKRNVKLLRVGRVVEPRLVSTLTVDIVRRLLVTRHLIIGLLSSMSAMVERVNAGLDLRDILTLLIILLVEACLRLYDEKLLKIRGDEEVESLVFRSFRCLCFVN